MLYVWLNFQELEWQDGFFGRLHRIEAAQLMRMALSDEPQRVDAAYRATLAEARGAPGSSIDADEVADARRRIEELERSGAMCNTPEEREAHRLKYRQVS